MISSIKIKGFRGFAEEQELKLSIPDGKKGSGLTVIVGPNNGGKSTIIEAFKAVSSRSDISFSEGQRNKVVGSRVEITLQTCDKKKIDGKYFHTYILKTHSAGGSEAERTFRIDDLPIIVLPSRRFFNPYSNKASYGGDRLRALSKSIMLKPRGQPIDAEDNGLFDLVKDPELKGTFDDLLEKVLGYRLSWTIDLSNAGDYYVKICQQNVDHDSDGLGEGLVSLLFLVEALLNSLPGKLLVIDEPELSLHPELQRNLLEVILKHTKDKQVLYATHSPEMVSIESILNGGTLCRVAKQGNTSKIHKLDLDDDTKKFLENSIENINFPHVFGYDARSCFFLGDGVLIVEGQEDVVLLKKALRLLDIKGKINFFGFGAGGAGNIKYILAILSSLGFERICCLYDGNKKAEKDDVEKRFQQYYFELLNANDIRDKECELRSKCNFLKDENYCKDCQNRITKGIFDIHRKEIDKDYSDGLKEILERIQVNLSC
ncbi:TPA: ATP-binding protein [Methanosarcina acetivorans]|uniref:AAA+ ATPase domain-containing protein n=2 Tax=Methanosarcina acetivorans TaxID=2214 RepID=Q8TNQ1_METAC|nr:AAA family ATPase [Methanosarcina acetivorans]AAM05627.1 predicted protein [Methanosarcina acetivorans C2A]HIH94479.1 ATP-binding protein [Methanosarcina acetivorans]